MSKHSDTINMIKEKIDNLAQQRTKVNDKRIVAQAEVDTQDRELQVIDDQVRRLNESRKTLEQDSTASNKAPRPA